jgi:hypothetical protein
MMCWNMYSLVMDMVMDLVLVLVWNKLFFLKVKYLFFLFYCKYEVPNWFGYGFYKIFCENFIFLRGEML